MPKKIGPDAKRSLVILHILFASVWIGAAGALLLLSFLYRAPTSDVELKTIHRVFQILDLYLIVPACFGSLFTGLFLSLWTNWGFFVYWWVLWKWILTVSMILMGGFFLSNWVEGMLHLSERGLAALHDPTFLSYAFYNRFFVSLQITVLLFLLTLSVFKPWGKRSKLRKEANQNIEDHKPKKDPAA